MQKIWKRNGKNRLRIHKEQNVMTNISYEKTRAALKHFKHRTGFSLS